MVKKGETRKRQQGDQEEQQKRGAAADTHLWAGCPCAEARVDRLVDVHAHDFKLYRYIKLGKTNNKIKQALTSAKLCHALSFAVKGLRVACCSGARMAVSMG